MSDVEVVDAEFEIEIEIPGGFFEMPHGVKTDSDLMGFKDLLEERGRALHRQIRKTKLPSRAMKFILINFYWLLVASLSFSLFVGYGIYLETKLHGNIKAWEIELEKSKDVSTLGYDDFSDNPIEETPKEYRQFFIDAAKKYNTKASIASAIAKTESDFEAEASNHKYDTVVIGYDKKHKKNITKKVYVEVSSGIMQINRLAHPNVSKEEADDPAFAIDWGTNRLASFYESNKDKETIFSIMCYNSKGAALNYGRVSSALKTISMEKIKKLSQEEINRAKFIFNYASKIAKIARNQKLLELHHEFFNEFMFFGMSVPVFEPLEYRKEDYRTFA